MQQINRRSLLKRMGVLAAALPSAGLLLGEKSVKAAPLTASRSGGGLSPVSSGFAAPAYAIKVDGVEVPAAHVDIEQRFREDTLRRPGGPFDFWREVTASIIRITGPKSTGVPMGGDPVCIEWTHLGLAPYKATLRAARCVLTRVDYQVPAHSHSVISTFDILPDPDSGEFTTLICEV